MSLWIIIFILLCISMYLVIQACGEAEKLIEKQHKKKKNKEGGK